MKFPITIFTSVYFSLGFAAYISLLLEIEFLWPVNGLFVLSILYLATPIGHFANLMGLEEFAGQEIIFNYQGPSLVGFFIVFGFYFLFALFIDFMRMRWRGIQL